MKKLTLSLIAVILALTTSLAQPVSDMGIIPVGITLNSILRLNITGGGNLEYSVNTMTQYTNGILPAPAYVTTFTVASSVHFSVDLYSDAANFTGVSGGGNVMPVGNLGYILTETGSGIPATNWIILATIQAVTNAPVRIINGAGLPSAGDITQNSFVLSWELATVNLRAVSTLSSLLTQNLASDRYVANVVLELLPTP
jgi:hypothetical protein